MIADTEECVFIKLRNTHFILRTQLTDACTTKTNHKKSQRDLREIVKFWILPVATVMFSDKEGEGFETESAAVFIRLPHWSHLCLMKGGHTSSSTSRTISKSLRRIRECVEVSYFEASWMAWNHSSFISIVFARNINDFCFDNNRNALIRFSLSL